MTTTSAVLPVARAAAVVSDAWHDLGNTPGGRWLRRILISCAVLISMGVAGVGGWRSYTAVSGYFGSWSVPAIADGVIVAATFLRLAALTYGWRMPGSVLVTILGLGGTVYLNIAASKGNGAAEFSHALAPIAYLILIEMLAHLLKLKLRLAVQAEARLTAIGWLVSPVVTSRSWLLMQRQGLSDPVAARVMVQRSIRARSQLLIICPSPWWSPIGAARRARGAALQTIRDGLLTAAEVVELLPDGRTRMRPIELLIAVNRAALLPAPAAVDNTASVETAPVLDAPAAGPAPLPAPPVEIGGAGFSGQADVDEMLAVVESGDPDQPDSVNALLGKYEVVVLPGQRREQALAAADVDRAGTVNPGDGWQPLTRFEAEDSYQYPDLGQDQGDELDVDQDQDQDDELDVDQDESQDDQADTAERSATAWKKEFFYKAAGELVSAGDLRILDGNNKVRIAVGKEINASLGLDLTLPSVRKYTNAYYKAKAGQK